MGSAVAEGAGAAVTLVAAGTATAVAGAQAERRSALSTSTFARRAYLPSKPLLLREGLMGQLRSAGEDTADRELSFLIRIMWIEFNRALIDNPEVGIGDFHR